MTDISQSTDYFLFFCAEPGLKLGQHLVDGRIVSVPTVVRLRCQLRLFLNVITYKVLNAARWRLRSKCPSLP